MHPRALLLLAVLVGCGDDEMCSPEPGELPTDGMYKTPYALPLPMECVNGGLTELAGRWFVVDPTRYFQFAYPKYEGSCETGFRRAFQDPDDHDATDDGRTFYTWTDGTRYFERYAVHFDTLDYYSAYAACMMPDDTLAVVWAAWDTERGERIASGIGKRFAPMDSLSSGLELVGELGRDQTGTAMEALNLVVVGNYAYVAGWSGLDVIDVSNPAAPVAVGHLAGAFNDVKVYSDATNTVAYVSPRDSEERTSVVDVTMPTAPRFVQYLNEYSHSLFLTGTQLYLATYNESVPRYDVSAPLLPAFTGMAIVPGEVSGVHDLYVDGTRIFANNTTTGLVAFDVQPDLTMPVERGRDLEGYSHASWSGIAGGRPIVLHGDEGMTRTPDGGAHLRILDGDASSPNFMKLVGRYQTRPEVGIHNFELHGDRAYIAYYHDGVRIVDLSDPANPRELAHYNTWDESTAYGGAFEGALGIRLVNGLVYVADDLRGLLIFREQ